MHPERVDDGAGCDFKLTDTLGHFCSTSDEQVTCYFEVKSSSGPFVGTFHYSENELETCKRVHDNPNHEFVLVFVEYAQSPDMVRFADVSGTGPYHGCFLWSRYGNVAPLSIAIHS